MSEQTCSNSERAQIQKALSYLCPKVERMVNELDSAEVTITFKECYRKAFTNDDIMYMIRRYMLALPLELKEILLVPEYGTNMNLHFHGIVRGKKKELSRLKVFLNKRFGRSTVGMVKYPESYKKYILKEQQETEVNDIIYIDMTDEEI